VSNLYGKGLITYGAYLTMHAPGCYNGISYRESLALLLYLFLTLALWANEE